jgi:hypothetical protein
MKRQLVCLHILFAALVAVFSITEAESLTTFGFGELQDNIVAYAILENSETGATEFLGVHLVEHEASPSSLEPASVTFEVGIPNYMLADVNVTSPSHYVSQYKEVYRCDSTSSVCTRLRFYFVDGHTGGVDWMYSQKVENVWTIMDSQVSLSSGELRARCWAEWFDKAGTCNEVTVGYIPHPGSGYTYSITPYFAGAHNKTLVNEVNFQLASQQVTLTRGQSSWNFYLCIANGGGSVVYGCY